MTTARALLTALAASCLLSAAAAATPAAGQAAGDLEQRIVTLSQEISALKRQLSEEAGKAEAYALANATLAKPEQLAKTDLTGTERNARDVIWTSFQNCVRSRNENLEAGQPKQAKDNCLAFTRDAVALAADIDQRANLAPLDVWSATQLCPVPVGTTESALRILFGWRLLPAWGLCLLTTLVVIAVIAYDRRVGLRCFHRSLEKYEAPRASSGAVTAAIGLLVCLTVFSVSCSSRPASDLERDMLARHVLALEKERDQALAELKKQQEMGKQLASENDGQVDTHVKSWAEHAAGASPEAQKVRDELERDEKNGHQLIRNVSTEVATAGSAGASARDKLSVLQQAADRIDRTRQTIAAYNSKVAGTRTSLYAAFLLGNCMLGIVWYRRRQRQAVRTFNTCPQCLSVDRLEPKEHPRMGRIAKCQNLECNYEMRASHRSIRRIHFPTVGYTQAGKTVWLLMFYNRARLGRAGTWGADFERVAPLGIGEDLYDKMLGELLDKHFPGVTPQGTIEKPLVFQFADGDWPAKSGGLLNLFDFAGQSLIRDREGTAAQERALVMDGFLYFLDPSRKETFDVQNEQLRHFRERLRARVPVGRPVNLPIAVCITKLDDLVNGNGQQQADKGGEHQRLVKELIATENSPPSLDLIRARHELFREHELQLFPGWDVQRQFQSLFGDRFVFFPMTSLGFQQGAAVNEAVDKDASGAESTKQRQFRPYGIIEPILWLLHMNGFQTLA